MSEKESISVFFVKFDYAADGKSVTQAIAQVRTIYERRARSPNGCTAATTSSGFARGTPLDSLSKLGQMTGT